MKKFLNTQDACQLLQVTGCALMHLREAGKLRFQKEKNAYLYVREDVERIRARMKPGISARSRHNPMVA